MIDQIRLVMHHHVGLTVGKRKRETCNPLPSQVSSHRLRTKRFTPFTRSVYLAWGFPATFVGSRFLLMNPPNPIAWWMSKQASLVIYVEQQMIFGSYEVMKQYNIIVIIIPLYYIYYNYFIIRSGIVDLNLQWR